MKMTFEKTYMFSNSDQITVVFLSVLVVLHYPFWGRIGREEKRERERENHHCEGFYFSVQTLLELLSPPLLMCIRSNSGRNHRTAAIPYFELCL